MSDELNVDDQVDDNAEGQQEIAWGEVYPSMAKDPAMQNKSQDPEIAERETGLEDIYPTMRQTADGGQAANAMFTKKQMLEMSTETVKENILAAFDAYADRDPETPMAAKVKLREQLQHELDNHASPDHALKLEATSYLDYYERGIAKVRGEHNRTAAIREMYPNTVM